MFFGGDETQIVFNLAGNRELKSDLFGDTIFVGRINHQDDIKLVAKH